MGRGGGLTARATKESGRRTTPLFLLRAMCNLPGFCREKSLVLEGVLRLSLCGDGQRGYVYIWARLAQVHFEEDARQSRGHRCAFGVVISSTDCREWGLSSLFSVTARYVRRHQDGVFANLKSLPFCSLRGWFLFTRLPTSGSC